MDNQISIDIRVRANASKSKVSGAVAERLLVFVQAPAVDGKANQAVIKAIKILFVHNVGDALPSAIVK